MNRAKLLLCFLGLAVSASAQKTFKYSATISALDTPGFYSITLQPGLVAKSKADLSDIRLMDDSGHFVPYVMATGQPEWLDNTVPYLSLPIVNKRSSNDTGVIFIVKNISPTPVDNLYIRLKNAAVERTLNLYGSDDLVHWFVIEENIPLQPVISATGSDYVQEFSFPSSNYHYLKLLVNGKGKAPIKFLAAETYKHKPLPTIYGEITGTKFVKRDSGKTTIINISLDGNYLVNKIVLNVEAPRFYNRHVWIYDGSKHLDILLGTEALRSGDEGALLVNIKTNKLLFKIENEDNPPLNVNKVKLFQADRSMLAYLEAGRAYKLLTGDVKATTPSYDLQFFTDSAKNHALSITHDPVQKNELYVAPASDHANERIIIIWVAILVALLLLSLLTWKMAGEVKKRGLEQ